MAEESASMPELLSPAGDFQTALAAFDAGADAVYCGLGSFSARAYAKNLTPAELSSLMRVADARGRKVYVAVNTLADESDLCAVADVLSVLEDIRPDGVIVQDLGVARMAREHFPSLRLHASTQLAAHNLEGVAALEECGFSTVVLARELSLGEISFIARRCGGVRLECFIHGALCYSISGLCLFSAMEKNRSGNRGRCAYCCRQGWSAPEGRAETGAPPNYPFSMKDLRLGESVLSLAAAGVSSLKIEGRMKSPLYVASATAYYRKILDTRQPPSAAETADLETVFSRGTTRYRFDGDGAPSPVDSANIGHQGARIGIVKRVAKDVRGGEWLRFKSSRPLERHDGIQIVSPSGGRPYGFGITKIRKAISRATVFETAAGEDVELLLPENREASINQGDAVCCSMSNAVKRAFPVPAFRDSDWPGRDSFDVRLCYSPRKISAEVAFGGFSARGSVEGEFPRASAPERSEAAARKAFSRTGGTRWRLGNLSLDDSSGVFAHPGALNELRRAALCALEEAVGEARREKARAAAAETAPPPESAAGLPGKVLKIRLGQKIPAGSWDEIVAVVPPGAKVQDLTPLLESVPDKDRIRLATPLWNRDGDFRSLRISVKGLLREGFAKWEAADLSCLHMLKAAGVRDLTADWTLYAFNSRALAELSAMGVKRFVASPENGGRNIEFLATCSYAVEFLKQQTTPLFISMAEPAGIPPESSGIVSYTVGGVHVTASRVPRVFSVPDGRPERYDLSWSV